jgi:hypothetical protein
MLSKRAGKKRRTVDTKTNGNGKPKQSILNQPLSELQKSVLTTAHENSCRASFIQVRDAYYGTELSKVEQERAQATIYRAKRALIKRGLLEAVPNCIYSDFAGLGSGGWMVAGATRPCSHRHGLGSGQVPTPDGRRARL